MCAGLHLEIVQKRGMYVCRASFRNSPEEGYVCVQGFI